MSQVVVITKNLMDATKVQGAVPTAQIVRSLDAPALRVAELILLDLSSGFDPATVVAIGPPVVAYGPHVDVEALEAARAAGCRQALPRSAMFQGLRDLKP